MIVDRFNETRADLFTKTLAVFRSAHITPGGGYFLTLPKQVCAAQRGRDFEAPDFERGIHFRGVF